MKGVLMIAIGYVIVGILFYSSGFGGMIGGTFFEDIKSMEGIGNNVPLALGIGIGFILAFLGAVLYLNKSSETKIETESTKPQSSEELVAASKEK